jgi:SAM-dependent methyltransferase
MTEAIKPPTPADRFENISNDYGELFSEVFAEQGLNYEQMQRSVFDNVSRLEPDLKDLPILDIGIGDGATSADFVKAGCKNMTGIDLSPKMVEVSRTRFGDTVRIARMNAVDLSAFGEGDFQIIVSGAAIHNIPTSERQKFWKELLRLRPNIFVCAEKIKDADPEKHKADYEKEIAAIKKIYGEKHDLRDAEKVWLDHYEYDEREALNVEEIVENIGEEYEVSVVSEMGLYKTVVAKRKSI